MIRHKRSARINYKWTDAFNEWVHKWVLLELNTVNKKITWSNKFDNLVMAKLDRIFVTTGRDRGFALAKVGCLDGIPSDHNPLLLEARDNAFLGKKRFPFEKWWLQKESFVKVVEKAWNTPCPMSCSLDVWKIKIRTLV